MAAEYLARLFKNKRRTIVSTTQSRTGSFSKTCTTSSRFVNTKTTESSYRRLGWNTLQSAAAATYPYVSSDANGRTKIPFSSHLRHFTRNTGHGRSGMIMECYLQLSDSQHFKSQNYLHPVLIEPVYRTLRPDGWVWRQKISYDQTQAIRMEYQRDLYISRARRIDLARTLSLSETQINVWFQNQRAKDKSRAKAQITLIINEHC